MVLASKKSDHFAHTTHTLEKVAVRDYRVSTACNPTGIQIKVEEYFFTDKKDAVSFYNDMV